MDSLYAYIYMCVQVLLFIDYCPLINELSNIIPRNIQKVTGMALVTEVKCPLEIQMSCSQLNLGLLSASGRVDSHFIFLPNRKVRTSAALHFRKSKTTQNFEKWQAN